MKSCQQRPNFFPHFAGLIGLLSLMALSPPLAGQEPGLEEIRSAGPAKGSILAIGGGRISPEIYQRFIQLAGGRHAPIVYIPSAIGLPEYGPSFAGRALSGFGEQGATNTLMLHAKDRDEADSEEFIKPLQEAGGVFFGGGRQWRLVDLYAGTKTEIALRGVLERGGVIGGSSAGATILGSYLARGDSRGNMIMMGDHEEGFGYLENVAIDQHLLRRNRQFDLLEIVEARPELLGIGLDEGAAIVVSKDLFEVMGGYVAIYDAEQLGRNGHFYFLATGDTFNLATRVASRYSESANSFWLPHLKDVVEVENSWLERLAGAYASSQRSLEIVFEAGHLHLESEQLARRPLKPISETSFLDAAFGELLTFDERDGSPILILGREEEAEILTKIEGPGSR